MGTSFILGLDQVIQIIAILASGVFIGWQIRSAKIREIESRVYEQRKEGYSRLLALFTKIFAASKGQPKIDDLEGVLGLSPKEYLEIQIVLSTIASEDVLNTYSEIIKASQEGESMLAVKKLGDMLLMIRKDVGIKDRTLSNRDVLSNFINDIHDPKYDKYFK
jgi:hypothetical protein